MSELLDLFTAANGISSLGVIAMLAAIIWMLVRGQRNVTSHMKTISENHLHELPELVENSRRTVDVLQRIEVRLGEDLTYIKGRVDGK